MINFPIKILIVFAFAINVLCAFAQPIPPAGYDWQLVINDEFDGAALDTTIWGYGSTAWGNESTGKACAYIIPENTYLENGMLVQRSTHETVTAPSGTVFNYTTGWSWTKRWLTYGYIEIRASYPAAKGVWPAFWMLKNGWPPEVDIAEYRGAPRGYMTHAFYDGTWDSKNTRDDYTQFHVFGFLWEPGEMKFFEDGVLVHSLASETVPTDSMYVILSGGVFCDEADGTGFPNYYKIDYFRWYQTKPSADKAVTLQEYEDGYCSVDGSVERTHCGYTGYGYADAADAIGLGINWKADFDSSGTQTFTVRYANGTTSNRPANLLINGNTVAENIDFFPTTTNDWEKWLTVSFTADVDAGPNDIRLEATSSSGLANIDNISITNAMPYDCGGADLPRDTSVAECDKIYYPIIYRDSYGGYAYPAFNLIDEDLGDESRWGANEFPQWVIIDYGALKSIVGTRLWAYQDRAYKYKIELDDNPEFTSAYVIDKTNNTSGSQPLCADFEAQEARYVRITVTGATGYTGTWVSLREFKIIEQSNIPEIFSFSDHEVGSPPSDLLDGDNADASRWSASGYPQWVIIDYKENKSIVGTKLWTYQDRAYQFKIELDESPNFDNPYVIDRTSNTSLAQPISNNFPAQIARYARITVTGAYSYTGTWVSLTEFEIIENTTGIENSLQVEQIRVYPNPAGDELNIDLPDGYGQFVEIQVFNILGQVETKELMKASKLSLDISCLNSGIYLLNISDGRRKGYCKFVKK